MMKGFLAPILTLVLFGALQCVGQQPSSADDVAFAAAEKVFLAEGWNPEIFERRQSTTREYTTEEVFKDSSHQDVKKGILKGFGNGPFRTVGYLRREATLQKNGGTRQCSLQFLVFAKGKVAIIDSRALAGSEDKIAKKSGL